MAVIRAIYENGVFKPLQPVALPEATEVEFVPRPVAPTGAHPVEGCFLSHPNPSPEEFRRILDEMASFPPGKVLPPDFSRDDIYDDHD
jgi:predicted DNA-binding antitoxin AbrB/MazE fold protein